MELNEFKRKLLDTGLFKKVSGSGQYRCDTCPFCGDNKKHMYVKIILDDDMPVVYNCFKCQAHGLMNEAFLSYFGIDGLQIPRSKGYKRINPGQHQQGNVPIELFNEVYDRDTISVVTEYIHHRVGVYPSINDLKAFQFVGNPDEYVLTYLGDDTKRLKGRVWFRLANGNISGRLTDRNTGERWLKYNSMRDRTDTNVYIIKKLVDTCQTINVCIAEGIMDVIGLYYHGEIQNAVYIACLGRSYITALKYVLGLGIFGDSVNIRFYLDSDVRENPSVSRNYRELFKSIGFYRNTLEKDFGYPADRIMIEKYL